MRTTDKVGFRLIIQEPDIEERSVVVCPRYEGLRVRWSRPSGKMYHERVLSGVVKFWGVDFVTVSSCALRTLYTLVVYDRRKGEIARCQFRKTDCKWDMNHGTCDVEVSSENPYKKIDDSSNSEYNLVKLGIDKHALKLYRFPIFQTYVWGGPEVVNFGFISGGGRAVSCVPTNELSSLEKMYFYSDEGKWYATFYAGSGTYSGRYRTLIDRFQLIDDIRTIRAISGGDYEIWLRYRLSSGVSSGEWYWFELYDVLQQRTISYTAEINGYKNLINTHQVTLGGTTFDARIWLAGCRLLTDKVLSGSNQGTLDKEKDIAPQGYKYGKYMSDRKILAISTRTSTTDKGYGRVENTDEYYDTPDDYYRYVPVWHESWMHGCSLWAKERLITASEKDTYKTENVVWDFYTMGDAIKAVVHEMDSNLVFEPDTTHSRFLFSDINPVSGAQQGKLYISQKSNVLNLSYDYPAWQAPITWARIETLLKNAFNCYWEIYDDEGQRHLRIEHLVYFENGGTYDGNTDADTIDLRAMYRTANRTPMSMNTNRWEWDKDGGAASSNANRYEYGWMDTQSAIFDGETIEVPASERLFEDDKVEERKVDWFSSDIDFITSVKEECSSDGFALVMESISNPGWIISDSDKYSGQNYQLSFEYMQPLYLLQGMYAPKLLVGKTEYANEFTARMRKAEIEFNLPDGVTVEAGDNMITEVGKGVVEDLEMDVSSEKWTATVRYNNE